MRQQDYSVDSRGSRCASAGPPEHDHRVSTKHLQAYLNEICFRFDNRRHRYPFRDMLLRMPEAENVEYKTLTNDDSLVGRYYKFALFQNLQYPRCVFYEVAIGQVQSITKTAAKEVIERSVRS